MLWTQYQDLNNMALTKNKVGARTPKTKKKTFNVQSRLEELETQTGLEMTLEDVNPALGEATIRATDPETGEEKRKKFDPRKFLASDQQTQEALKQAGIKLEEVNIEWNRADQALDRSALGFVEQMDFVGLQKRGDKRGFLNEKFGKENVKILDDGQFAVKGDDEVWRKAESGFLATLAKTAPTAVAGAAGAAKGAAAAAFVPVPGARVVGAVIGGGVGASLSKVTDIATAEAAGIRTESDFEDAKNEVAKEFIDSVTWDVAFRGGGKIAKGLVKGVGGVSGLSRPLDNWAETAENMTDVNRRHFEKLFDNRTTKRVLGALERNKQWIRERNRRGLKVSRKSPIDPASQKQLQLLNKMMGEAKEASTRKFKEARNILRQNVPNDKLRMNTEDLTKTVDDLEALINDETSLLRATASDADINKLRKVVGSLRTRGLRREFKALGLTGDLNTSNAKSIHFDDALKMRKEIDEVLERTGAFKTGDFEMAKAMRIPLFKLRDGLSSKMNETLSKVDFKLNGKQVNAGQVWKDANAQYHNFRNVFDNFAVKGRIGNPDKTMTLLNQMFGGKGGLVQSQLDDVAELIGPRGRQLVEEVRVREAGKQLAPLYSRGRGSDLNIIRMLQGDLTSPRRSATAAIKIDKAISGVKKINETHVNVLNKMARGVNFLTGMNRRDFNQAINSPQIFRGIMQSVQEASREEERLTGVIFDTSAQDIQQRRQEIDNMIQQQQEQQQQTDVGIGVGVSGGSSRDTKQ